MMAHWFSRAKYETYNASRSLSHTYQVEDYASISSLYFKAPLYKAQKSRKLAARCYGPFLVTELIGKKEIRVQFPQSVWAHNVVHVETYHNSPHSATGYCTTTSAADSRSNDVMRCRILRCRDTQPPTAWKRFQMARANAGWGSTRSRMATSTHFYRCRQQYYCEMFGLSSRARFGGNSFVEDDNTAERIIKKRPESRRRPSYLEFCIFYW